MFSPAAFVFLTLTILELFALVTVAGSIGVLNTIGLLILVSILGVVLLRVRGVGFMRGTIESLQAANSPETPSRHLASQFLALLGAILLVIPGFVTAGIGVLLMVPPVRSLLAPLIKSRVPQFQFLTPDFVSGPTSGFAGFADRASGAGFGRNIVDVDLVEDDPIDDGPADEADPGSPQNQRPTRPELN